MGNTQSAPQHNRLVKPKTNSNSAFSSPTVPSPASSSTKYLDLHSDTVIRSPTGDFRSRHETRHQLKAQLTSPIDTDFSQESDEDDSLGELATHVRDRLQSLSRSNSVASQLPSAQASTTKLSSLSGSKLSLVPDSQPVDLESAISILQELRKNASPDDLAALREALQPEKPTESVPTSLRPPTTRKPVPSKPSQSLIRRRSLATPGLATRGSPTDLLRKPVEHLEAQLDDRKEHEWQVSMMGHSPLTRLASLDVGEEGSDSSTPRAQTPGDMAYSHLGALKLGSLMVTNGAASPAPSVRSKMIDRRKSTPDLFQEEDYFTASEGAGSPSPLNLTQHRGNRMHLRSHSSVLPMPSPLSRESRQPGRTNKADQPPRSGSPLKRETVLNESKRSINQKEDVGSSDHAKNKSAPSIAQEYMDELATSPFATQDEFSEHSHDNGHLTSTRVLLDEGSAYSKLDCGWTYGEEAFSILNGTIFADPTIQTDLAHEKVHQNLLRYKRPSHTKADSGYSSGGSLRALRRDSRDEDGTIPSLPPHVSVLADEQEQSGTGGSTSLNTKERTLLLSAVEKPDMKAKPSRLSISKSWKITSTTTIPTLSAPLTPSSVVLSESTDGKKSATHKRLQKRRPSSQSIPLMQTCEPVKEGTIPTIPDNIRAHFTRRLSESPGMGHLTQTFTSASHTSPDEDDSGTESPCISAPIRFPSPAEKEPRKKHHNRSQSARPPTPPPHRQRRSLSVFRSQKADTDKDPLGEELLGIADFGTVAKSLGGSPYDIALSTLRKPHIAIPTHPHQLGAALPSVKPRTNMDASTATEFAKMRSRGRAALGTYTERPRSYHEYNLEAGEAVVARRLSNQSRHTDVPPLPHLDSNKISLVRASITRDEVNLELHQTSGNGSARPKLITRETSVSALIEKFNEAPVRDAAPDWEAHSRLWRQRRKSIGEGLRLQHGSSSHKHSQSCKASPQAGTPVTDHITQRPTQIYQQHTAPGIVKPDSGMLDRYGGGLGYDYEYGLGVGGSAGTRHIHSEASRKSMHFSNEFGIDLSDVPVFLQKVR